MIRVLIVDDEKSVRNQIAFELTHKYPYPVLIDEASNGFIALQKMEADMPDVLLADIRMPKMDGGLFAKKARALNSEVIIIFITAYADKDILKQAIKMGVSDFIEKPIITCELVEAVVRAREKIKERIRVSSLNNPKTVLSITKRNFSQEELFSETGQALYRKIISMKFQTVIINCIPVKEEGSVEQGELLGNLSHLLDKWSVECLYSFKTDKILIAHFCFSDEVKYEEKINPLLEEYMQMGKDYYFFCCLGKIVKSIDQVYVSYEEAVLCHEQSFFARNYGILKLEDFTDEGELRCVEAKHFYSLLKDNRKQEIYDLLEQLYQQLLNCRNILVSEVKKYYIDIVDQIFLFSANYHLKFSRAYEEKDVVVKILSMQWIQPLHSYVCELLEELSAVTGNVSKEDLLVGKVTDYIKENITDPTLGLEKVADYCSLTSGYVNTIFKNKIGLTLNDYIGQTRMKCAYAMLIETNETLESIALHCGYGSPNYFYKVFKKKNGMTPAEWRGIYRKDTAGDFISDVR